MDEAGDGGAAALGALAVLALVLCGFALSRSPLGERADGWLLDAEWAALRAFSPRAAPDEIVIVGVDEASVRAVPQPLGAWNEPLGEVLVRIASAQPTAIGLAVPLPDRSLDGLHPGLDRALLVGLAAARRNGPFVVAISIDARTRAARPIFPPYLAVIGTEGLGIDLLPRDADGVTRSFSLLIPTEDGGYPTLAGRLCQMLSSRCGDGLIDFALGEPYRYVPFHEVLAMRDARRVRELFGGRIVLIGAAQRYTDRVSVPYNLAAWEPAGRDAPGIVVHAQALRTALLGAAPAQTSRPLGVLLLMAGALLVVVRGGRLALAATAVAIVALLAAALFALRAGTYVPVASAIATVLLAALGRAGFEAWRNGRFGRRTQGDAGGGS